jgi:hypothetical protein
MKSIQKILMVLFLLLYSSSIIYASDNTKQLNKIKTVSPVPSAILMNAYRYLGTLKHFSVDAVTDNDDYLQNKILVTFSHNIHIDLQRPSKLYIDVEGDLKSRSYYLNSGDFTAYDKDLNYYGKLNTPKNIDDALDYLFEKYDIKTALANILYSDLDKRTPPKNKGFYFGISEVNSIKCHHIAFAYDNQEMQLWIEVGNKPLIHKFSIVDKSETSFPRSTTTLKWSVETKPNMKFFIFDVAKKAIQINIQSNSEEN